MLVQESWTEWLKRESLKSNEKLEIYSRFLVTKDSFTVDAPTFSQAFRWFREKYKIHSVINLTIIGTWYFELYDLNDKRNAEIKTNQNEFKTPEEAELACLLKLIEIVKNK